MDCLRERVWIFRRGETSGLGPGTYYLNGIGSLSNADTPVLVSRLDQRPTALLAGGFIQDSWSIADRVTVNLGIRLDGEYISDQRGNLALALNNQWSPRLGVIWDPTYHGGAKIYASYALYYETVPLESWCDFNYRKRTRPGCVHELHHEPGSHGSTLPVHGEQDDEHSGRWRPQSVLELVRSRQRDD